MRKYQKPISKAFNDFEKPNEYGIIPAIVAAAAGLASAVAAATPSLIVAGQALGGAAGAVAGYKAATAMMKKDIEALSYNSIPTLNPIIVKD
ncbi:hypothetical protein [Brachyspira pulli]|uniref:hypothetical protein n=1 Tax=Brachyspira pulli TaxID=310721 RepID=UPI003004C521